jgi:AraC-like DNA-binding protein
MLATVPLPELLMVSRRWLDDHPDSRPSVADIARATGRDLAELRRSSRRFAQAVVKIPLTNLLSDRQLVAFGCLVYSVGLIIAGMKIEAAMLRGGFHHRGSFNVQVRMHFGCAPHELRGRQDLRGLYTDGLAGVWAA